MKSYFNIERRSSSKLTQRSMNSSQLAHHVPKATQESSNMIIRPGFQINSNASIAGNNNNVYYSIKYLGITKGQIGILSKRSLMPCLSSYQTCKDVPLAVINSSISKPSSRQTQRIIRSSVIDNRGSIIITEPIKESEPQEVKKVEKISYELIESSVTPENEDPHPEDYNEYVIHTYARPNGLTSVRKPYKERFEPTPVKVSKPREGVAGWKLSRPRTAERRPVSSVRVTQKKIERKIEREELNEFFNEPYLKFLHEKKRNEV